MVDVALQPAIKMAIQANELGSASPYGLSFAGLGSSGASFGVFQGDTHVNQNARATLAQVLATTQADPATIAGIMAALSQACPNGNPLSADDTALVNGALASAAGQALVDAMDASLLDVVLAELDSCISASARAGQTIQPEALLYIALWVNMTGAPNTLNAWLAGSTEVGMAPPAGPEATATDLQAYLQANTYFKLHPRNFLHIQQSVAAAVGLLP